MRKRIIVSFAIFSMIGFLFVLHVGNENLIAGEKDVGILALFFQVGIVGMIPDSRVVREAVLLGNF